MNGRREKDFDRFLRTRQHSRDAQETIARMFGQAPPDGAPVGPREEVLRAIAELRRRGELAGNAGMVLEIVETLLREGKL